MSGPLAHQTMSAHALPAHVLEQAGQLMAFNWLVAADAHEDWLGAWSALIEPSASAETRLLRHASAALLDRHRLNDRYLKTADGFAWLLLPPKRLEPVARELGTAMLGGWVRDGLTRGQVAQQLRVLGSEGRTAALRYAASMHALPYAPAGLAWPMADLNPSSVVELGVSCMAALLDDEDTGARDRFLMRFPRDFILPIRLSDAQRGEAQALIQAQTTSQQMVSP